MRNNNTTLHSNQIIQSLQEYPSSPFGNWTTFNTNNPHGYYSWDKSIYPDGIRYNNTGSGKFYADKIFRMEDIQEDLLLDLYVYFYKKEQ